ncbi:hypothetical protein HK096_000966, partial [Nowakowskiella sp. JEL0078]
MARSKTDDSYEETLNSGSDSETNSETISETDSENSDSFSDDLKPDSNKIVKTDFSIFASNFASIKSLLVDKNYFNFAR